MDMDNAQQPARDPGGEPQQVVDPRRWKALAVICVAQFMLILDITVVIVALPSLEADLDLTRSASAIVVSAYTLFFGGLILLGGRLADAFGARSTLLIGLTIFTLASLASGLAQNELLLIGGRVCQGIGAALMSPSALSSLTRLFQGKERNRALAVWSMLGGLGFVMGVLVGGLLAAGPGWRWVFFINIPVGVFLLATIPTLLPRFPAGAVRSIDVLGAAIVTVATGLLIFGMLEAGNVGWASLGALLPIAVAIVLYGLFVVVERAVRVPLMPMNLLARRPVMTGAFLMLVASGVSTASIFIGSQYLQHLRNFSALDTGLFFLPVAVATAVGARTSGRLVGTLGTRSVAAGGLALAAIGNALLTGVSTNGNVYAEALPGFVVFGLGIGSLFVAATTSALGNVRPDEAGLVSGLIYTLHELGPAALVALASTVAAAGLSSTPTIDGFTAAFIMFSIVAAVAAVLSLILVPSAKKPPVTDRRAAKRPPRRIGT